MHISAIEPSSVILSQRKALKKVKNNAKYTRAPQTVHNTPVMNILKGYFYVILFYKKPTSNLKFQLNLSIHVGGTCRKWMDRQTARRTQSYATRTWSIEHYTKSYKKFKLNMSKHLGEKCRKLCISSVLSSKRGMTPTKNGANWRHSILVCSTLNKVICKISVQYVKAEKCGMLCISSFLRSKRDITPTKIDANWWHSNLICSTVKQSHMQNFSSTCQSM